MIAVAKRARALSIVRYRRLIKISYRAGKSTNLLFSIPRPVDAVIYFLFIFIVSRVHVADFMRLLLQVVAASFNLLHVLLLEGGGSTSRWKGNEITDEFYEEGSAWCSRHVLTKHVVATPIYDV